MKEAGKDGRTPLKELCVLSRCLFEERSWSQRILDYKSKKSANVLICIYLLFLSMVVYNDKFVLALFLQGNAGRIIRPLLP